MAVTLKTEANSKAPIHRRIEALAAQLRRRQLIGSYDVAVEVVRLIKEIVAGAKFTSFAQLVDHIAEVGQVLQDAGPKELVINNMTRRILKNLQGEYTSALETYLSESSSTSYPQTPYSIPPTPSIETPSAFFPERGDPFAGRPVGSSLGSMFDLLGHGTSNMGGSRLDCRNGATGSSSANASSPGSFSRSNTPTHSAPSSPALGLNPVPNHSPLTNTLNTKSSNGGISPGVSVMLEEDFTRKSYTLKPLFIEAITEVIDELETTYKSVGEQAVDHIHSGEFILTIGHSRTVEAFLKAASRKRKFTVIVAETAPSFSGRSLALSLSIAGIATILIPDSNIFSLLPRCSKVLVSPHLILANGSLLSIAGSLPLCLAASKMRVPVVVVGGMYKFSPIYLGGADWGMRDLGSPGEVLEESGEGQEAEVLNPYFDVVPAEIVSLYITNLGGHPSSLLYRLLSDMYGST